MDQPPQRNWWSRNWKWVVPVGCLTPVVVCGGGIALLVFGVFGAIKSSDVYTEAIARAKANEEVQAALGEPIEEGFLVSGNINVSDATGNADLAIPISGPKGNGTIHAVATKVAGKWEYSTLEVEVPGRAGRIDLRPQPAD
ncbi:MAG: cytochrome c oxidase assembly factor 1 family protein [Planctomycetales bacterium]